MRVLPPRSSSMSSASSETQLVLTSLNGERFALSLLHLYARPGWLWQEFNPEPGPIFFLTPRKCGVHCEAAKSTFLEMKQGNVANVAYYFEHHGMEVYLHADNCSGQNCMPLLALHDRTDNHVVYGGRTHQVCGASASWSSEQNSAEIADKSAVCNVSQLVSREDSCSSVRLDKLFCAAV